MLDEFDLWNVGFGESNASGKLMTLEQDADGDHEVGYCHGIDDGTVFGQIVWYEHLRIHDKPLTVFSFKMTIQGKVCKAVEAGYGLIVELDAVGCELGVVVVLDNSRLWHNGQFGYRCRGEFIARFRRIFY